MSPPARGERLPAQQHSSTSRASSTDPRVPTRQNRSQRGNELVAQNELVLTEPHRPDDEPSQLRQSAHEPLPGETRQHIDRREPEPAGASSSAIFAARRAAAIARRHEPDCLPNSEKYSLRGRAASSRSPLACSSHERLSASGPASPEKAPPTRHDRHR